MKNKLQIIAMLVVVSLILAILVFVKNSKETPIADAVENATYNVTSFESSKINQISYTNNGVTDTYIKTDDVWSLENSTLKIDTEAVKFSCALMSNFSSNEKLDEATGDYGTSANIYKASAILDDNSEITFTVGNTSPDGVYNYIKVTGSENDGIYMMPVVVVETLVLDKNQIALKDFEQIDFPTLNKVVINQKDYQNLVLEVPKEDVKIAENLQGISKLIMQSPYKNKTIFMQNFIDEVFPTVTALKFGDLVENDSTDLSKYGFNEPFLSVDIISDNGEIHLVVGSKESEKHYYAKNADDNNVFIMNEELLKPFINIDCFTFLNSFVALVPIESVGEVNITKNDVGYDLTVDETPEFAEFYKKLVSLQFDGAIDSFDKDKANEYLTINFSSKENSDDNKTFEFYNYNDKYCVYYDFESETWFTVDKAQLDNIAKSGDALSKQK